MTPAGAIYKHNPREYSAEELRSTFVARDGILADVLDELRARAHTPTNQHFLIIGPRGIGKTNLLLMIRGSVEREAELAGAYLPIQTAEEEYSISGLRDFLQRLLEIAGESTGDEEVKAKRHQIRATANDEQAAELGIAALRELAEKSGRKLLLLIDNLDMLLGDQIVDDAEQGRLRDLMMNESFLVLIGAAPTYFREVSGYDRPFYNFFRPIELEDLVADHVTELLKLRAKADSNEELAEQIDVLEPRIRAIHHLTGGNPRLVLLLYQLSASGELEDVQRSLRVLLDEMTPYYKHRMEALSAQQRKVMDSFARLGRPATPTEIAEETRLPVNQVSANLKRLADLGFVALAQQSRRRKTYYVVSERVFRIWHQMRFSVSSRRLEFFVEFLRIWYTPGEWKDQLAKLFSSFRTSRSQGMVDESSAYLEHIDYMTRAAPSDQEGARALTSAVKLCVEIGEFDEARRILRARRLEAEANGDAQRTGRLWFETGMVEQAAGHIDAQIAAFRRCLDYDPSNTAALRGLGSSSMLLAFKASLGGRESHFRDAVEWYRKALRIDPESRSVLELLAEALRLLGGLLHDQNVLGEAIEVYGGLVEKEGTNAAIRHQLGRALAARAELQPGPEGIASLRAAIEQYEFAIDLQPDSAKTHFSCGNAFVRLAKSQPEQRMELLRSAIEHFRGAIRQDPNHYRSFNNWGDALRQVALLLDGEERRRHLNEAIERFQEALRIEPNHASAYINWGTALVELAALEGTLETRTQILQLSASKVRQVAHSLPSEDEQWRAVVAGLLLDASALSIRGHDLVAAKQDFSDAVNRLEGMPNDSRTEELVKFFGLNIKQSYAEFVIVLITMLKEQGLSEEASVLEPFARAAEYWISGNNEEILDRLNPETREIVEQIVKRGMHAPSEPADLVHSETRP